MTALYLGSICRGAVLAVFAVAVFGKVRDRAAFGEFRRATVALSGVRADRAGVVAVLVVAAEAAVVGGLATDPTAPWAFTVAAVLLGAFSVALWRGLRAGVVVPCRCLGATLTAGGGLPIVRNLLLLALVAVGLWATGPGGGGDLPPPAGVPVCLAGAAVLAGVLLRLDQLADVFTARL
ncbi:MauE/DoxX family redox-associated membrane protein [Micromonospora echinospora]|uniref:MauE/DoxX family redox-associated membrane protein n=1 Tax=Micromonospora echinospora TaxID=1877 RepID=UPI0033E81931